MISLLRNLKGVKPGAGTRCIGLKLTFQHLHIAGQDVDIHLFAR